MGLSLKRDCKIKWSSLLDSIQRGIDVRPVLQKFLEFHELRMNDSEWEMMEEIAQLLRPCKVTVEALCREDADLLTAEVALKKLFKTLRSFETVLADELCDALVVEIKKRWLTNEAGLLKYLNNPDKLTEQETKKKRRYSDAFLGKYFSLFFFSTTYLTTVRYIVEEESTIYKF